MYLKNMSEIISLLQKAQKLATSLGINNILQPGINTRIDYC